MKTYEIILHPQKKVIIELKLSTGEYFKNVKELWDWCQEAPDQIIHGESLKVILTALKSVGLKYFSQGKDSIIHHLRVGKVEFINIEKWGLGITSSQESVKKIEKMLEKFRVRGGKLPSSPAGATIINFSSKTRNIKVDPVNVIEALAGSSTYGHLLGYSFEPAYRGGLLANPAVPGKLYKNVKSYDLDSAYPAAIMAYNFPSGASTIVDKSKFNKIVVKGGLLYGLTKEPKKTGYIGVFKASGVKRRAGVALPSLQEPVGKKQKNTVYDRLGFLEGEIIFGACPPEMALFQEQYSYETLEILELSVHSISKLPKAVRKYAGELYAEKLKTDGDEKTAVKLMINSLIGCWGRDPLKDFSGKVEDLPSACKSLAIYNGDGDTRPSSLNTLRTWDFRWAIYINSYVRYYIHKTSTLLQEAGAEILYSDTDSVKFIGGEKTEKVITKRNQDFYNTFFKKYDLKIYDSIFSSLGTFKEESEDYIKVIFYTKRGYLRVNSSEEITPVISGARRGVIKEQLDSLGIEKISKEKIIELHTPMWRKVGLLKEEWGAKHALQYANAIFTLNGK